MNWYFTKLVYRFICGSGKHTPQFNEQVRVIEAEDALHAFYKARQIGEKEAISISGAGLHIRWKFIDVTEILPVVKLTDGAEVYSAMQNNDDADGYIKSVYKKANALLEEGIFEFNTLNPSTIATNSGR